MTVILALTFKDGVLLASDSQMTADQEGQPTRAETQKLFVLGERIGWGASGSVGLTQRVRYELAERSENVVRLAKTRGKEQAAAAIFDVVNGLQRKARESFIANVGREVDSVSCLFAGYAKDGPYILEIDRGGSREFSAVPYNATGSGSIFAVHAIRSVAHYNVATLTRDRALALAYRAIDDAIQTAAFGLGGKVQLLCVTPEKAWCLDDAETKATQDLVFVWKQMEVENLGLLGADTTLATLPANEEPPKE